MTAALLIVRLIQVAAAAGLAVLWLSPPTAPGRVALAVTLLGERELPDGSWSGVDLLAQPYLPAERFQLTLRPERDLRLVVEAHAPDGTVQRLFPEPGKSGTLAHGKSYALPAPASFFALEGEVRLVLTASPMQPSPAEATQVRLGVRAEGPALPLSDGARIPASVAALSAQGPLRLELSLRQR